MRESVGIIKLNRPKQLNSLNSELINELIDALNSFATSKDVKVAILTGNDKAFAAGADIAEMAGKSLSDCVAGNFLSNWETIGNFRKPLIAAVNGYAVQLHSIYLGIIIGQ